MKSFSLLVGGALAAMIPSMASAAVVIDALPFDPSALNPTPQIHNTGNQSGNTVTGITVGGGYLYDFTSASTLSANGSGHAKVAGPFHELTLAPQNSLYGFTAIDFNLNVSAKKTDPFFADIILTDTGGNITTFDSIELGNGQNKYLIYGDAGEIFTSIAFVGWRNAANTAVGYFDDLRQVDIDTVLIPVTPPAAVPEPATWAMMIAGFGLAGAAMRRKARALSIA